MKYCKKKSGASLQIAQQECCWIDHILTHRQRTNYITGTYFFSRWPEFTISENQKILWLPSIYQFERTGTNLDHPTEQWNWNQLVFLSFIFSLGKCVLFRPKPILSKLIFQISCIANCPLLIHSAKKEKLNW